MTTAVLCEAEVDDALAWLSRQPKAIRMGPAADLASGYMRSGRPQPPPQVLQRAGERRRR